MPSIEHRGAHIYYEEFGQGFPILTFAPAGLASVIDVWSQPSAPINPTTEFADKYRVIAMDQRNAGGASGPLQRLGRVADGSSRGDRAGARRVLPQPLRRRLHLLLRPRLRKDGQGAVPGAGRQR